MLCEDTGGDGQVASGHHGVCCAKSDVNPSSECRGDREVKAMPSWRVGVAAESSVGWCCVGAVCFVKRGLRGGVLVEGLVPN